MLLNLMVYVVTVSLLLGLAAWAFERAVRMFAFPTRWIWVGAMGGSLGYALLAVLRPAISSQPLGTGAGSPLDALLMPVIGSITQFVDSSPAGEGFNAILGVGWVVLTLSIAAVLLRAHQRLRADRSTWTPAELDGRDVLVSEDLGPGVVGWIRSVIVMPRWAFGMPRPERELMLRHEGEHCRAGDTRVAGLALFLLAVLPWNLPLWWQVHRLRLAIEIDCDHRVLHGSADVKRYARLLVEIGARGTASRLSALAFARPIPSIERRILAMTDTRDPRYLRTAGLTLLALLLVVASCQVEQVSINIEVEQTTPQGVVEPVPSTVVDREAVAADGTATEPEPEVVDEAAGARIEALARARATIEALREQDRPEPQETEPEPEAVDRVRAAIEALREQDRSELEETGPEDVEPIQDRPVFTPMTVRPRISNTAEVQAALMREYPPLLRDAGIGGTVVVWFYVTETGQVADRRISESSGHTPLDEAALNVANVFQFTPAMNRDEAVAVWIQLPITFQRN